MQKRLAPVIIALLCCLAVQPMPVYGDDATQKNDAELENQFLELKAKVADLEKKNSADQSSAEKMLQSIIAGIKITGGISAGFFYTSNAGQGTSDNEFLLSNLLVEISQKDKSAPIGFSAAVGETSTPSLLSTPENNNDLDIEYASLSLRPVAGLSVETGLLQPYTGYESTYTFNNNNAFLGALASQQPYNAYGARLAYDLDGLHLCASYYKDRLDRDEYVTDGFTPNNSWELGLSGALSDTKVSLYHYHLENLRNLTGAVIERTIAGFDVAVNLDYWRWAGRMRGVHEGDSSIGAAIYIIPRFGRFSLPVRLEFIDQGKSAIYLESTDAQGVYAVTLTPTYHIRDNAYARADFAYVRADNGFADSDGNVKSDRFCFAAEVAYLF